MGGVMDDTFGNGERDDGAIGGLDTGEIVPTFDTEEGFGVGFLIGDITESEDIPISLISSNHLSNSASFS
jgi:hypothetical protein